MNAKKNEKGLWYLAAPYSHKDDYIRYLRVLQINKVASHLFDEGYWIFSPISHTHPIKEVSAPGQIARDGSWEFWKEYDEYMLSLCDGIIVLMLDGYENSVGVTAEHKFARENNIPVLFFDPLTYTFLTI